MASAIAMFMPSAETPNHGCLYEPVSSSSSISLLTVSEGIAKPMPVKVPVSDWIATAESLTVHPV